MIKRTEAQRARTTRLAETTRRSERGAITLIELLVTAPLLVGAMSVAMLFSVVSVDDHDRVGSRVSSQMREQGVLARLTRELGQATKITGTVPAFDPSQPNASYRGITFLAELKPDTPSDAQVSTYEIEYGCANAGSLYYCWRKERPENGTWPSQPEYLFDWTKQRFDIRNSDIFALDPPSTSACEDEGDPAPPTCLERQPRFVNVKLEMAWATSSCRLFKNPAQCPRAPRSTNTVVVEDGVELPNTRQAE